MWFTGGCLVDENDEAIPDEASPTRKDCSSSIDWFHRGGVDIEMKNFSSVVQTPRHAHTHTHKPQATSARWWGTVGVGWGSSPLARGYMLYAYRDDTQS